MWNEVMLWLTQMICYNVCIPLLIRQMNDVEENLNPTILDVPVILPSFFANYSVLKWTHPN